MRISYVSWGCVIICSKSGGLGSWGLRFSGFGFGRNLRSWGLRAQTWGLKWLRGFGCRTKVRRI